MLSPRSSRSERAAFQIKWRASEAGIANTIKLVSISVRVAAPVAVADELGLVVLAVSVDAKGTPPTPVELKH